MLGLSLKKLAILGCIGVLLFIFKFFLPKAIWYVLVFLSVGLFFFFNFVQIGGQNIFELLVNAFRFFFIAHTYAWWKKEGVSPVRIIRKAVEEKAQKTSPLKLSPGSHLSSLRSKIDVGEEYEEEVDNL